MHWMALFLRLPERRAADLYPTTQQELTKEDHGHKDCGVQEIPRERCLRPCIRKIGKGKGEWRGQIEMRFIFGRMERSPDRINQRRHPKQGQGPSRTRGEGAIP